MEVIEDRHDRRSTLIVSQLTIEYRHDYIGEATLADAILDRLLHGAHRLTLTGESMRKDRSAIAPS
jgi:DNA replication protein DnaC